MVLALLSPASAGPIAYATCLKALSGYSAISSWWAGTGAAGATLAGTVGTKCMHAPVAFPAVHVFMSGSTTAITNFITSSFAAVGFGGAVGTAGTGLSAAAAAASAASALEAAAAVAAINEALAMGGLVTMEMTMAAGSMASAGFIQAVVASAAAAAPVAAGAVLIGGGALVVACLPLLFAPTP